MVPPELADAGAAATPTPVPAAGEAAERPVTKPVASITRRSPIPIAPLAAANEYRAVVMQEPSRVLTGRKPRGYSALAILCLPLHSNLLPRGSFTNKFIFVLLRDLPSRILN